MANTGQITATNEEVNDANHDGDKANNAERFPDQAALSEIRITGKQMIDKSVSGLEE